MADRPQTGEKWQHYNGLTYTVLYITNTNGSSSYPETVVYKGGNGCIWSRPLSDWHRSMTKVKIN